jgi:hypothetical protein
MHGDVFIFSHTSSWHDYELGTGTKLSLLLQASTDSDGQTRTERYRNQEHISCEHLASNGYYADYSWELSSVGGTYDM